MTTSKPLTTISYIRCRLIPTRISIHQPSDWNDGFFFFSVAVVVVVVYFISLLAWQLDERKGNNKKTKSHTIRIRYTISIRFSMDVFHQLRSHRSGGHEIISTKIELIAKRMEQQQLLWAQHILYTADTRDSFIVHFHRFCILFRIYWSTNAELNGLDDDDDDDVLSSSMAHTTLSKTITVKCNFRPNWFEFEKTLGEKNVANPFCIETHLVVRSFNRTGYIIQDSSIPHYTQSAGRFNIFRVFSRFICSCLEA